jgi:hypothetical protein
MPSSASNSQPAASRLHCVHLLGGAREVAEGCDVQERLDFPDGDVQGIS